MKAHLEKPLHARITGANVITTTNYRRMSAHQHRIAGTQKAALVFLIGVIAGVWLAAWVTA